jgi:predicted Zn-dependent peptidase
MVRNAVNWVLPALLVLATPMPASAAAPDKGSVNIQFERYQLDNGLEIILHEDHSAPLIAVDVWYHVGSGNETPGKSGFAHLFEHMMFQGAKHIGEDVHFDTLKKIGGTSVNGTTNTDRTNYFEIVPSHQLETGLWLESDRMGYLLDLLNEKSLGNQRDVVRNERRQNYDNRPFGRDRFAVAAAMYPEGHPYRYLTIGRHEEVEGGSIDDVRNFFLKWYVPSNATLTLAGDFDSAEAKKLIEKWFGSFPKAAKPTTAQLPAPALDANKREEIEDPFARYERIHYAWHSPATLGEESFELQALGTVLSSDGWGRLSKALVLPGIAQRAYAYQSGAGHTGTFHLVVDLKPGADRGKAEKIVQQQLDKAMSDKVSDAELSRVVLGIESSFVWSLEELLGRAERLQWFNHYAGDPGYTDEYLERMRKVTPGSVQAAAKKWLGAPRVEIITKPGGGQ